MTFCAFWKRLSAKQLAILIQVSSLIAIFFEGYDQGGYSPEPAHYFPSFLSFFPFAFYFRCRFANIYYMQV
jgi:hypothetical protein